MSVIWYKVWFDLWQRKGRTLMVVLSIAAGVFAIGAIFGMVDQLLSNMDAAHLTINPSHMNVILRDTLDRETAESLTRIEGISGVEPTNTINGRYKTSPDAEWETATFYMRADFDEQVFDFYSLLEGEWPSKKDIAIERMSEEANGVTIGDTIIFELDGIDRPYEVTGRFRHPFVQPPQFGGDTAFAVSEDVVAQFGIPKGQYSQMLVTVEPYSEEYARDRMDAIKDQLSKQGIGVAFAIYQKPDEHWGRPFMLGFTYVLQILAVVSLLASVILVVNTMTSVITQQTNQIGVIKAIGGTADIITRIYLAGVLVYGILAAIVALPLGMMMAFGISQFFLSIFNIDHNVFEFSTRAVTYQIIAALIAPLIAALIPILQGAWISVREAIASYGLGGDFGSSKFDQMIERIGARFLSSPYAIALGNMFRRKGRLLLTQSVLIIAGTMFILVQTLSTSITATLENELNRREYNIRFALSGLYRANVVETVVLNHPLTTDAEGWYTVTGTVLQDGERIQDAGGLGTEMFGVPTGSEMYEPFITNGRWLTPNDFGNVAVISQDMADFNDLEVGDQITVDAGNLGEGTWEVIGTYQAITPDPFATDPVYVPEGTLTAVTKKSNRATQLYVTVDGTDPATLTGVKDDLLTAFDTENIEVSLFQTRTSNEERDFANEQFGILTSMLFSLAVVMGLVGGIGLMGALSISVVERTREIGVLRAIGAETLSIMGMFVMEGLLQGIISWLIAVPLAFFIARPMATTLGEIILETALDFTFSYTAVFGWLFLILFISVFASVIPAWNASKISVRESLSYQ